MDLASGHVAASWPLPLLQSCSIISPTAGQRARPALSQVLNFAISNATGHTITFYALRNAPQMSSIHPSTCAAHNGGGCLTKRVATTTCADLIRQHGTPLLLWRCERLPWPLKLVAIALLEYAFSYGLERTEGTSTVASSAALQAAHALLLYAMWTAEPPPTYAHDDETPSEQPNPPKRD